MTCLPSGGFILLNLQEDEMMAKAMEQFGLKWRTSASLANGFKLTMTGWAGDEKCLAFARHSQFLTTIHALDDLVAKYG